MLSLLKGAHRTAGDVPPFSCVCFCLQSRKSSIRVRGLCTVHREGPTLCFQRDHFLLILFRLVFYFNNLMFPELSSWEYLENHQ